MKYKHSSIRLFILFLALVSSTSIFAQTKTGSVKGTVTTKDGKAAVGIDVVVKALNKGTNSDEKGKYIIKDLVPGQYTLKISGLGIANQERKIIIAEGTSREEDFKLDISFQQLEDVVVYAGQYNYQTDHSEDVAKMPLNNIDNPQVYSVVTKELLKDQFNTNITQALNNVPGAVASTDPAGGVSITVRGFTSEPSARNGMPFIAAGRSSLDPVNIESIEVLKGPAATLFGNAITSYGGAVNLVTKKPFETFKGEVSYSMGSWGLNRVTADINTPLNLEKTALFRVNAVANKQNSYMSAGHMNRYAFDPSLLLKVNDRLTLSFDLELYQEDGNRVPYLRFDSLVKNNGVKNVSELPIGYRTSLYADNFNAVVNTQRAYFQARYEIAKNWTSLTNLSVNNENVTSYQGYPTFYNIDSIKRSISLYGVTTTNFDIQHNLQGDFLIGGIRNRFVWGLDYLSSKSDMTYSSGFIDGININKTIIPVTKEQADYAISSNGYVALYPSEWLHYATYISDLANITDRLMALASVRIDRYERKGSAPYGQTSAAPRFGLVYQPVKGVLSLFGNYMSGFQNNSPSVQPDGTQINFKASYARQWEAGIKVDGFSKRLTASLSYYNIDINDALRTDGSGFVYQDGKQRSKGIELDLTASPAPGLNLTGGYVYNDNQYIKATSNEGKQSQFNPKTIANFWVSYKFLAQSALKGFGLGFGGNYADKSYYDASNTIIVPSYTIFNGSVFFEQEKWRAGIALNNIGNKKYWSHSFTANPQPLRQVTASVSLKF